MRHNVSKCCSIYSWTPCCRSSGQENPSNSIGARTPLCMEYEMIIGQTSRTPQADIEVWGLLRLHLFWGALTRRARASCRPWLGGCISGRLSISRKAFASMSSTLIVLFGTRGRIFQLRAPVTKSVSLGLHCPQPLAGQQRCIREHLQRLR